MITYIKQQKEQSFDVTQRVALLQEIFVYGLGVQLPMLPLLVMDLQ